MVDAYRRFLEYLRERSDRFTFSNPGRVLGATPLPAGRIAPPRNTRVSAP
jgi:hypothetical protein